MSPDHEPPDPCLDSPTTSELESLELFRRSPHPYLRHKDEIRTDRLVPATQINNSHDGRKRRTPSQSQSPSESGTEADDEAYTFVKALPPPPLRPHKGLRDGARSPLLTPTQIDDEGRKYRDDYFPGKKRSPRNGATHEEARLARLKYLQRRRMELVRRTTETALLVVIAALAVAGCACWDTLLDRHRAHLVAYALVILSLLALYPLRVLAASYHAAPSPLLLRPRIHVPAAFDPATILYPTTLPVLISLSLYPAYPAPLLPNILLALAALPARLIPFRRATLGYSNLHWLLALSPLLIAPDAAHQDKESLATLFALHHALLPPLYYLTTTSLLPTELHLLAVALVNLLLFAQSPQARILQVLMWVGGVGLFVMCGTVLVWGVQLARIPRWRLRRAGRVVGHTRGFLSVVGRRVRERGERGSASASGSGSGSDGGEDACLLEKKDGNALHKTNSLRDDFLGSLRYGNGNGNGNGIGIESPASTTAQEKRKRRNTLPTPAAHSHTSSHRFSPRKRSHSLAQSYLSLTPAQATLRKWAYAGYFYLVVVLTILGPIRHLISTTSLRSHEPFGWAASYLFGNMARVRWEVYNWDLETWIRLPPLLDRENVRQKTEPLVLGEYVRHVVVGEANTRLVLAAYCAGTIALGLASVFSLSAVVEVDTRRKVFHGTMVAMLLPTIFIDPCFVALALALVLAIFLLLDLIRASQLPPLSKPIAKFLTPYVDGRDLRGPVVVSHIFLLIGCAIPLWLSLAGTERVGEEPWEDWNVKSRDVSMLAGVICVGMGDAAASLIGRRYGRRKWPWAGGKSLEGSLAFAVAVTLGLVVGKAWLAFGWGGHHRSVGDWARDAVVTTVKAALCAAGASLNEAVLTGGNDNVIVPVVLWILVRGVRL